MKPFAIGEYRESFGPSLTGERFTGETNWEPNIGEPETRGAPARSFTITPEMQARDAAERDAAEARPQTTWSSFRDTLSEDNLRVVRRPVGAGRKEGRPAIPAPTPKVQRAAKAKPAPKVVVPPEPHKESTLPRHIPDYVIQQPVLKTAVPNNMTPYQRIFRRLLELEMELSLPVEVANEKAGLAMEAALKVIANKSGLTLKRGRDIEGSIFFFHLEPAASKSE